MELQAGSVQSQHPPALDRRLQGDLGQSGHKPRDVAQPVGTPLTTSPQLARPPGQAGSLDAPRGPKGCERALAINHESRNKFAYPRYIVDIPKHQELPGVEDPK